MRYLSAFSGIEAASVAWAPLGWEPMAFAEIEPFPCAVLAARFPGVPNLGDVTKIDWSDFVRANGTPDVLVGGSPCQSFSIAGGRAGLAGASGLMWEYVRAVREVRPRWVVWENVPGALSSTHGEDFGCLLRELDGLGYGLAWRVLDAQFFGVAQRRRRLFLVGRLGDPRGPAQVLLEPHCLRWDTPSSRAKREELAARAGRGAQASGFCAGATAAAGSIGYEPEQHPTLRVGGNLASTGAILQAVSVTQYGVEVAGTPTARADSSPCADRGQNITCMGFSWHNGGKTGLSAGPTSPTIGSHTQPACAIAANQRGELRMDGGDGRTVGAIPATRSGKQLQAVWCRMDDNANAATDADMAGSPKVGGSVPFVGAPDMVVRRLMPVECERLQGFPDGWTDIPWRGREHAPDTPRYMALGNSMAVPVMAWIGRRMAAYELLEGDGE